MFSFKPSTLLKLRSNVVAQTQSKTQITFLGDSTLDNRIWVDGLLKSYIYSRLGIKRDATLQRIQKSRRLFFRSQLSVIENIIDLMPSHEVHDFTNDGFTTRDCLNGAYRDKVFGRGTFSLFPHKFFQPLLEGESSIKSSEYVVISIGGNDVREFLQSFTFLDETEIKNQFTSVMRKLHLNYIALLEKIQKLNPGAKIVLLTQYYPSAIQNNYKIYEKMKVIGKILNIGGEFHDPMNVLHELMKITYAGIFDHVSCSGLSNVFAADITSSLNPFDNNNHVSQIEPSVEGGKKIAQMIKYLITSDHISEGKSYRFYPEFFTSNDEDKYKFVAKNAFSNLNLAHPFDLREGYSLEEENIFKKYEAEGYSCDDLLEYLKRSLNIHDASRKIFQAGLALWTEAYRLLSSGKITAIDVKKFKMSIVLSINVLDNINDINAINLLHKNASERAFGKADKYYQFKAALAMFSGVAIFGFTLITTPDTKDKFIGGTIMSSLLISAGAIFFFKNRQQHLAKTISSFAKEISHQSNRPLSK